MNLSTNGREIGDAIDRVNGGDADIGDIPDKHRPALARAIAAALELADVQADPDRELVVAFVRTDDAVRDDCLRRIDGGVPDGRERNVPTQAPLASVQILAGKKLSAPDHGSPSIFEASR